MSRTWAIVTEPTFVLCGSPLPFWTPAAFLISSGAGGVFVMKVNDRSSKMVISTGMTFPRWVSVAALYCLTKSMMLTPCGPSAVPTGGAGVAWPACSCTLTTAAIFFFRGAMFPGPYLTGVRAENRSDLADLIERELDRGLAAEDRDEHLELLGIGVDLVHGSRERRERAVHHGNRLAHLEVHRRGPHGLGLLRCLLLRHRREQRSHLAEAERRGLARQPDETGHAGSIADRSPRLVGNVHAHQDVTGQHLLLDLLPLAALDLGHLMYRHLDLEDVVLHVERLGAALQIGPDPVLVSRVGVHHIPVAGKQPQLRGELGDGIGSRLPPPPPPPPPPPAPGRGDAC